MRARGAALTAMALHLAHWTTATPAHAWAEHEHAQIGKAAIHTLLTEPTRAELGGETTFGVLEKQWERLHQDAVFARSQLRSDGTPRPILCASLEAEAGCIGLRHLPMLAGDHACDPDDLRTNLQSEWVDDVVRVAEQTGAVFDALAWNKDLSMDELAAQRLEARREMDVDLQVADPDYLTRAAGNSGHFAVPRSNAAESLFDYLRRALPREPDEQGHYVRQNATALYVHYHQWALYWALEASEHPANAFAVRQAFLHEAFALHFLQDSFAAGHIVGAPKADAVRMGMHDHYCKEGLDTQLWSSGPDEDAYVAHGDAFLFEADLFRAQAAMRVSLDQLASAFSPEHSFRRSQDKHPILSKAEIELLRGQHPALFAINSCSDEAAPLLPGHVLPGAVGPSQRVIEMFPRPAVGPEPWSDSPREGDPVGLPSYRAEYGAFIPIILDVKGAATGFVAPGEFEDQSFHFGPEMYLGTGIGVATDGVLSDRDDGLFYAAPMAVLGADIVPYADVAPRRVAAVLGAGFRLRVPFAYVPGDVLIWGPLAGAGTKPGYEGLRRALSGGFLSKQSVFFIGGTRVQLDLGREAELMWRYEVDELAEQDEQGRTKQEFELDGFDVTLPVLSTRLIKGFDGNFGPSTELRLSARIGNRPSRENDGEPDGVYVGGVLSLNNVIRVYLE